MPSLACSTALSAWGEILSIPMVVAGVIMMIWRTVVARSNNCREGQMKQYLDLMNKVLAEGT